MSRKRASTSNGQQQGRTCKAIRKKGGRCTARAVVAGFCIGHAPGADEARRKGGSNRANVIRLNKKLPPKLNEVGDKLATAINEVHEGSLEPRRAQAMAALAGALVRVVTGGEMEERVRRLEDALSRDGSRVA